MTDPIDGAMRATQRFAREITTKEGGRVVGYETSAELVKTVTKVNMKTATQKEIDVLSRGIQEAGSASKYFDDLAKTYSQASDCLEPIADKKSIEALKAFAKENGLM